MLGKLVEKLGFETYVVRGVSMRSTLEPGDLLLVSLIRPDTELCRWDVVVLNDPVAPTGRYLKRVVGLSGEKVCISDGLLFVDGRQTIEPHLGGMPSMVGLGEWVWTLGDTEYFVMGDNRAHSTDSRQFGPVDRGHIVGKATSRYWPPSRVGRLR